MIPDEKHDAVIKGLREAFGASGWEDAQRMVKGLSADLVFRIVVAGSPYLLRLMAGRTDPNWLFEVMEAAAKAGLGPAVRYRCVEDGIAITDFVEAGPFGLEEARRLMPGVLRRLHAMPRFGREFPFAKLQDGFIARFRGAKLAPEDEVVDVFRMYAAVCATYPRVDEDMVSAHNDLKPENVLFDGARVWLVDWEAAFANDRYFELAMVTNFLAGSESEERVFLEAYWERPVSAYELARLYLMRQVVHLMYASVFLLLGSAEKAVDWGEPAPSFQPFHERMWRGEIELSGSQAKVNYGRVHWRRLVENARGKDWAMALGAVCERHADGARLLPIVE
ncbi:MAG: phosphotransferase [Bryobacteraceae bacterium]